MPTPKTKPRIGAAALPDIKFSQREVQLAVDEASRAVAGKMGVAVNALPAGISEAIKTATVTSFNSRAKSLILRDADSAVKSQLLRGASPMDMLGNRLRAAKDGIAHIAADGQVRDILNDTAKLLFDKLTALKTAGFTDEQAFNLLLAEVSGRAGRSR